VIGRVRRLRCSTADCRKVAPDPGASNAADGPRPTEVTKFQRLRPSSSQDDNHPSMRDVLKAQGDSKAVKAILFDLDGTLIDTTDLILHCFNHSWHSVFGRTRPREAFIATMGIPLPVAMRYLLASTPDLNAAAIGESRAAELVEQLLFEYRSCNAANHDSLARSFDEMTQVVAELRRRHYLTGVVTSKSQAFASRGLKLGGFSELMDTAVFMEDTQRHKPDPEPLHLALERLQISAQQAVYVGDSCHDLQAGRAAGVRTVAALWGPAPARELLDEHPDLLAAVPTDLLNLFE
jgi:pyrophosphatase PpaX